MTMNLPKSLAESVSVYCTCKYFDFHGFVEIIFLANLTLKMMLAYNDGDIVTSIKTSIHVHKGTLDQFSCLSGSNNDNDNKLLLAYNAAAIGST
jgi:hypothetical protein